MPGASNASISSVTGPARVSTIVKHPMRMVKVSKTTLYELHPVSGGMYWLTCAMAFVCGLITLVVAFRSERGNVFLVGLGSLFLLSGFVMLVRRQTIVDAATRVVRFDSRLFGVHTLWSRVIPFSEFDRVILRRVRSPDSDTRFVHLHRRSGRKLLMRYFNVAEGSPCCAAEECARRLAADFGVELEGTNA
jgi:hypothetical protein